jgi:multicomponent Na+:H+ antiporter subunit G
MKEAVVIFLMLAGSGFMLLAAIGIVRMPDLFLRMQTATKASTLGIACMMLAVAVHFPGLDVAARALLIVAFFFLTAPVAAHVIARAAYLIGVRLWDRTVVDEMRERGERQARIRHDEP